MTSPVEAETMTAIAVEGGKGPPEALKPVRIPIPTPAEGQVLIRVRAAGVNRPDIFQRQGNYPPPPGAPDTIGLEVAGEIVKPAGRWKVGDKVCALLGGGGYAEYAAVDARHVLPIPGGLSFVEAAALPETVFTVYTNAFEGGSLKAGETLLVHGANSGIGTTAIALGKAAGAKVIATARGAAKKQAALASGADIAVDVTTEDFAQVAKAAGGVDVVLDIIGAAYFEQNMDALNTGGRIVYVATLAGGEIKLAIMRLMQKRARIAGSTLRPRPADEKARLTAEVERVVWPWIEAGKVKPEIQKTFPLEEAAKAHAYLDEGSHVGKVVLTVG